MRYRSDRHPGPIILAAGFGGMRDGTGKAYGSGGGCRAGDRGGRSPSSDQRSGDPEGSSTPRANRDGGRLNRDRQNHRPSVFLWLAGPGSHRSHRPDRGVAARPASSPDGTTNTTWAA